MIKQKSSLQKYLQNSMWKIQICKQITKQSK
jgi:hypothetical protein